MKCLKCGAENPDGSNFCQSCGTGLAKAASISETVQLNPTQPNAALQPKASPKAHGSKKLPIIIIVAALLLIAVIGIIAVSLSAGGSDILKNSRIRFFELKDDTVIAVKGTKILYTFDSDSYRFSSCTTDGKVGTVVIDGVLYRVTEKGTQAVVSGVPNSLDGFDYIVSENGDYIVYTLDGELVWFNAKNGEKTKIERDAYRVYSVVLSPNGKSVAYSFKEASGDKDYICRLWENGKSFDLGKNFDVIGLSDSAKYIWLMSEDDGFYISDKKGNREKLASDVYDSVIFNSDYSQALYLTDSNRAYLTDCGADGERVFGSDVLDFGAVKRFCQYGNFDTLTGHMYLLDTYDVYELYYIDKNGESESLDIESEDYIYYSYSQNGKYLYYVVSDGELYRAAVNGNGKPKNDGDKIANDVYGYFRATPDGKGVYYMDDDDTLYFNKGGDKKRIAYDVESFLMLPNGTLLFLTDDDTLCSSVNGGEKNKIADDVKYIFTSGTGAFYYMCDYSDSSRTCSLYGTEDGSTFKLITDQVIY